MPVPLFRFVKVLEGIDASGCPECGEPNVLVRMGKNAATE